MSYVNRFQTKGLYEHLYKTMSTINNKCVYCGDKATTLDHVPALCCAALYPNGHIKVPACVNCNSLLGGFDILTIKDRKQYLLKKIKNKNRELLDIPEWDEFDFEGLSGDLIVTIKEGIKAQKRLKQRLLTLKGNTDVIYYSEETPVDVGETLKENVTPTSSNKRSSNIERLSGVWVNGYDNFNSE